MYHAVYRNLIIFSYTFQLILLMFMGKSIILCQSHLTPKILVKYVLALIYYAKMGLPEYLLIHQNNSKMPYWPQNTSRSGPLLSGSHAAIDSNKKLFSASIMQLQSIVLFSNTYG